MNTMNMPGFTAEDSLYKTSGHYQAGRHAINSPIHMITPAIPPCRNCDYILNRCESNGWRPLAVCNACARGYCYEDQPGTGDPAFDPGICPRGYNPDYNPALCIECTGICDTKYPIEWCEGSNTWCNAINAEALRKRRNCYQNPCGTPCAICA